MKKQPRDQHTAEVGARLRNAIKATHPTLKAWCKAYGYSDGALQHVLNGQNYPDLIPLIKWCDEKGMSLDFIFRDRKDGVVAAVAERLKQPKSASRAASQAQARQVHEKTP